MIKVISNNEILNFKDQIVKHLLSLTKEERYLRFFKSMNEDQLNEWLEIYACSKTRHYFILTFSSDLEEEIISIGQLSHSNNIGEVSFSVSPEKRNKGLASLAVETLLSLSKNLGLETVLLICKSSNSSVVKLLEKFNFDISFVSGEIYGSKSL